MAERSINPDHATVNRWVVRYAPQIAAQAQRRKSRTLGSSPQRYGIRHRISAKILKSWPISAVCSPSIGLVSRAGFQGKDAEAACELLIGEVVFAKHVDMGPGLRRVGLDGSHHFGMGFDIGRP